VELASPYAAEGTLATGDGRPDVLRSAPPHALSQAERAEVLRVANEPRFASVPPARIVPMLADEGAYLASESSFLRVLREQGQTARRGCAKAPRPARVPTTHIATAPRQMWCGDMNLPANVRSGPVGLSVPDPGPVQPQDRRLGVSIPQTHLPPSRRS